MTGPGLGKRTPTPRLRQNTPGDPRETPFFLRKAAVVILVAVSAHSALCPVPLKQTVKQTRGHQVSVSDLNQGTIKQQVPNRSAEGEEEDSGGVGEDGCLWGFGRATKS